MIRHRPEGRGHPYLVEPDQRIPVRPSTGDWFELRATTSGDASAVHVELEVAGERRVLSACLRGAAVPDAVADYGVPAPRAGEGHLSDAVSRLGEQRGRISWAVHAPALERGQTLRYRFWDERSRTRWFDVAACDWVGDGGELHVLADEPDLHDRIVKGSVEWHRDTRAAYRCRFALRLEPDERIIGFGERFDSLDQRRRLVDVAVFDQYKGQGARTYLPMPFAIVIGATSSFGFHLDTGHRVRFDVGRSRSDRVLVEVDLEPGRVDPQLTLRLFAGSPAEILAAFTATVGRPAPPPEWIYRLWVSGNEWNTQERVLAEVDRSLEERIPVGVVVIEAWSDEETFVAFNGARYEVHGQGEPHRLADFHFPDDGPWPDPKALVDELHAQGIKVLLWQIPLVHANRGQARADRRTMIERRYCVFRADGKPYRNRGWWFPNALLPDFTNLDAAAWWTEKRRYLIEDVGIDGFKTDGGEHAWGTDLHYADGTDGGEANNRYPVHYAAAYHQLLRSAGRNPVTFSRAGFTGSGAYPCHWAGDEDSTWEAFRASLTAGLSAGASGVFFWGWDLAGFSGEIPTPELYLRAAAAACFCPIMQFHSEFNRHRTPRRERTPWNIADRSDDERVLPLFRRFVELRERLVPYLGEQARRSIESGKPLMRALCFEVDRDESIWEFPYEWFLGDDLLVAPVVEEGSQRSRLYLPAGDWVDPWSGDTVEGAAVVERPAPLHEIPVYVAAARAARLVPLFTGLGGALPPSEGRTLMEVS
jgi:1,3-alpha-isomaltosidase